MKKLKLFSILFLGAFMTYSQDIIIKRDGSEIESKVIEITETTIKYKKADYLDGPVRNIAIIEVFMIIYENGLREKFQNVQPPTVVVTPASSSTSPDTSGSQDPKRIEQYGSVAWGYGNSFGGYGVKFQYVTSGKARVGFHAGAGYFPSMGGAFLYAGGIQIYVVDYLYINPQFGAIGVYENYSYSYYNNYGYYNRGILYGVSLMVGYDWYFTQNKKFGLTTALGASLDVNNYNDIWLALDSGFILKF